MKRNPTAIIGLGNYLLGDEGVGLHAIQMLETKLAGKNIDLVEGGVCGMNLMHQFEERTKVVFIDAGNCGVEPGQFTRFRPGEVVSRKKKKRQSLHEFDLLTFLEVADKLGKTENVDVIIYCIQPQEITLNDRLSPQVQESLPIIVEKVYNEVN